MAVRLDEARIRLLKVSGGLEPTANNSLNLGTSSYKWKNVYATTFTGALSGNATSATKATQDGDGNVIKNTYLKLAGGTMTGNLQIGNSSSSATTADAIGISVRDLRAVSMAPSTLGDRTAVFYFDEAGPSGDSGWKGILRVKGWTGSYAAWELAGPANSSDTKEFYVRSGLGGGSWGAWRKLLTSDNYTSYTVTKTGAGASGNSWAIGITGNAATATKLATARAINGTNFDGTGTITTANWGTARTLTIGNKGQSVNGSGNVSWTLADIGAVPKVEGSTNGSYTVYRALGNIYKGGTAITYYRIALPQATSWGMIMMKLAIRENYGSGSAGEIIIYANHSSAAEWNQFYATCIGKLSTNIKVYGSDKKYFYIAGNFSYGGLSVELMTVGDAAASINLGSVVLDTVTTLPTTYQTATMYYGLHSGNYNDYAPTKTGTGASGTWGISVTGSSGSCTGNAATASNFNSARTITLTGDVTGSASSNGASGWNITTTVGNDSHTHSYITSSGTMTMISGTAKWTSGFTVGNIYNSGYPFNYGTTWMYQGTFGAELIFDGVGGDAGAGTGHMYFRTRSDWATSTWGDWKRLLDSSNYSSYALPLSGGTLSGSLSIAHATNAVMDASTTNPRITFSENGGQPVSLVYTDYNNYRAPAGLKVVGTGADASPAWFEAEGDIYGAKVYGAVWNDYAEYRESDCIEPGRVLIEKGDDTLTMSTEHMQPFAGISSDTFGFAIGETETAKTPIAVAGRVLVYTNQDRNIFKPGDVVCAGPNGTVEKMSRNEIIQFPDRIVGTVSCVPEYEIWVCGNGEKVQVNGRIWIKVR